MMHRTRLIVWLVLLSTLPLAAYTQEPVPELRRVSIVYIGSMGSSEFAERFRLLLDEELTRVGFSVSQKEEKAQATLTGVLTYREEAAGSYRTYAVFDATVRLVSLDGTRLWGGDFGRKWGWNLGKEPLRIRAMDVAEGLRDAVTGSTTPRRKLKQE